MSHANARTTFHGRKLIVERWLAGWRQAHIAAAMGISRKCVRTWIARFQAEGVAGLIDRSSRPHTSPRRTAAGVDRRREAIGRGGSGGPERRFQSYPSRESTP